MKKLITFIVLILFFSCTAKKTIIEKSNQTSEILISKNRTTKDSIFKTKKVTTILPTNHSVKYHTICDSLGNARPLSINLSSGSIRTKLIIKDNTLDVQQISDSIKSVYEKEYYKTQTIDSLAVYNSYKSKISIDKTTVEHKYPLWLIFALVASVLLNILQFKIKS